MDLLYPDRWRPETQNPILTFLSGHLEGHPFSRKFSL